jgi:hypothetical protein
MPLRVIEPRFLGRPTRRLVAMSTVLFRLLILLHCRILIFFVMCLFGIIMYYPSKPAMGLAQPSFHWVPEFSPGVKRPGRGVDHPSLFIAEVKERVELYHYSPSRPSRPVLG